ncbi:hypothetical protein Trydic_g1209 [Trypoxylus dichotomus]
MSVVITNPTSYETQLPISRSQEDIMLLKLTVEIYGRITKSKEKLRQWCFHFKEGHSNVHDEQGSGSLAFGPTIPLSVRMQNSEKSITLR